MNLHFLAYFILVITNGMMKSRLAHVHEIIDLGPHLRRIVLSGDDLIDFPLHQESAHVKVIFPTSSEEKPNLGFSFGMKKRMRSYTIRHFDIDRHHLTLDFVVNDHEGLAANWAAQAKIGDQIGIAGPGPIKHKNFHADWHLLVGDLTALPAIAATLERLPENSIGFVILQVPTKEDQIELTVPERMTVIWVKTDQAMVETVGNLKWLDGVPAIFIACEATVMKNLRMIVKGRPKFDSQYLYASGYWHKTG